AIALPLDPPSEIGCRLLNSDTGNEILRTTWNTPELSRSHSVSAFCSASSRNKDERLLVQLGTGAAPTRREVLEAPLICSFTLNTQLVVLGETCSFFSTTARRKLRCVSSNSGLPSPSISAALSQGCWISPPGGATSISSKSWPGTWRRIFTFS